jgi:hypothetical protein
MNNLRILSIVLLTGVLLACGTVQNKYQLEDDDAYFSRKQKGQQAIITPDVDLNKIMQKYPSKVNEGTFDNRPNNANPNASFAYGKYRTDTDSLYKKNPQLASNYNPYKAPVFDEREEARRSRRLNNLYNNSYSNSSWGYNNYGWNNYGYGGWNSYTPGWNLGFGMSPFYNFNNGFGCNSIWGNCNFYNPFNNFGWGGSYFSPFNSWGYSPFYPSYNPYFGGYNPYYGAHYPFYNPIIIDNKPSGPPTINRPRVMSGSDIPPTSNGLTGGVNTTSRPGQIMERGSQPNNDANTNVPSQSNNNAGATLKRDESGTYQYTPPTNYNRATGATETPNYSNYSGYSRDNQPSAPSFRSDNNVSPSEQRNNNYQNNQQQNPTYNRQYQQPENNFSRPSHSAPSFSVPSAPRNGGSGGGGGSRPRM